MEICVVVAVLVGLGLLLVTPYVATRACLSWVAHRWPDPRLPEAARGVRRAAWLCVAVTIAAGLGFSGYCYERSITYVSGPWLDFGAELWGLACFLPLGALFEVVVAIAVPVRVSIAAPTNDFGFRRVGCS